ncbi:MAG: TlpA disulfide reductase family protein [Dysgonamonadaceae bacterium]|jgi:peroxiredoxin|nr:TlpA disulfide reductase family protein [Dysgonamonadaceae bacterium]MEA5080882.1 TlpA disulfide reductase family protein [Dysgonamonadaceae bacterium]
MKYVNYCIIAIVSLVMSSGSIKTDTPLTGYHPGSLIPNIVLNDAEGKSLDLSDYKGKKVVVNFWAAYDAQSRATNVQLYNFITKNYPDIEFISISFDENKSVYEKTILWDKMNGNSNFCDVRGTESEIYKEFRLDEGFKNFVIDEDGVITATNTSIQQLKSMF